MKTTISIIIPTYKPNSNLLRSLNKLSKICFLGRYSVEVVIINTISQIMIEKLIKNCDFTFRLKIINIEKKEFNHGETRNLGIRNSKGEYIMFLSQDAYPLGYDFINHFIEDLKEKNAVSVFGGETAPKEAPKDYLYYEHLLWQKQYEPFYDKKNRVLFSKNIRSKSKNSEDIFFWYSLSNVFSCYKANFLRKHHFETIYHGEDVMMGKFIIENGFKKIFDSRCQVEHFHGGLKNYIVRNVYDWYFRIFVLKSGLKLKIKDKINLQAQKKEKFSNFIQIYFFYLLKIIILIIIFLIKLKQITLINLMKEKKTEYIKRYI